MPCCGGQKNSIVQALQQPVTPLIPSTGEVKVRWIIKPQGMTKYVMQSGRFYTVYRQGAEVVVSLADLPELVQRGLAEKIT